MTLRLLAAAMAAVSFAIPAFAQTCGGSNLLTALAAQDPQRLASIEAEAAQTPNGEGILWRVEKDGLEPSYLFGTVHLTDDRLTALPPAAKDALANSKRVIVENVDVLDPQKGAAAMAANAQYVSFTNGDKLSAYLSEDDKALLAGLFGGSLRPVEQMKPWMLAVALAVPACEVARRADHKVVDAVVADYAKENGLELAGLESVAEQLSAFDGVSLEDQAAFLMSTARLLSVRDDMFATMGELYLERRIALIDALTKDYALRDGISRAAYDSFTRELVERRNARMADRSAPYLAEGASFIAVGALHLPFDSGLVASFRRMGYEVTRID